MLADLGAVILNRAARPLVKAQITDRHLHLAGNEVHRLLRQLRTAPGKPARPCVELQQQRETQLRRAALASHQLLLILEHSPVLDQLVHPDRRPPNSAHPAARPPCRTGFVHRRRSPGDDDTVVWGW